MTSKNGARNVTVRITMVVNFTNVSAAFRKGYARRRIDRSENLLLLLLPPVSYTGREAPIGCDDFSTVADDGGDDDKGCEDRADSAVVTPIDEDGSSMVGCRFLSPKP